MRTVYIDELFLLNLAADYIILYATAQMNAAPYGRLRLLGGAAFGGAYAVAAYFGFAFTDSFPMKLLSAAIMLYISFGFTSRRLFLRRAVTFFVFSFLMGGAAYALSLLLGGDTRGGVIAAPWVLRLAIMLSAAAIGLLSAFSRGSALQREIGSITVKLTLGTASAEFEALRDSGNTLRDPLDGSPVLIAELDAIAPLFDADTLRLLKTLPPTEAVSVLPRSAKWRLIPYHTAAGSRLALAFRPDGSYIDGKQTKMPVALSEGSLGAYPALVGDIEMAAERRDARARLKKVS